MAALDFPASPTLNQVYTSGTLSWTFNGVSWVSNNTVTGATGGGTDTVFYENSKVITTSYTITSTKNAMSAGDITINSGATVTVPTDCRWIIL
jgi:hypothetical protein